MALTDDTFVPPSHALYNTLFDDRPEIRCMSSVLQYVGGGGASNFLIWLSYIQSFTRSLIASCHWRCFTSKCTIHPRVAVSPLLNATPIHVPKNTQC
jgi:hypothetical protein